MRQLCWFHISAILGVLILLLRRLIVLVRLFGTTARETLDYFLSGPTAGSTKKPAAVGQPYLGLIIIGRLFISVIGLCIGGLMMWSGEADNKKFGAGLIGLIIGYWLK